VSERASIHTQRRRVLVTVPIQSVCFSRRKTDVEHSNQTMTGHPSEADSEEGLVSLRAATYRSSSLKQSRAEQSRAEARSRFLCHTKETRRNAQGRCTDGLSVCTHTHTHTHTNTDSMKPRPASADEQLFQPVRVDDETDIAADPDPQLETVISDAVSLHRGDVSGDPQGEQMQLRSLCREGHEREPDMAGAQRSTSECKDSVVTHVDALSAESSGLRYSLNAAFTEHMSVQIAHADNLWRH
jgi:hypothetical protein